MQRDANAVEEARAVIDGAVRGGIPLRLIGGLAVRFLTPEFTPREREGQDMDLARLFLAEEMAERNAVE